MSIILFLILGLIVGAVQLYRDNQPRTAGHVSEILLLWLLVITVGLGGIMSFVGHTVFAERTAESIGWASGSPFQTEVAVANLSIASLGILSYWFRGTFWIAAVIGKSVWELGDAVVHIQQMLTANNYSPNNAGVALYADVLTPVILLALLIYYQRAGRRKRGRVTVV